MMPITLRGPIFATITPAATTARTARPRSTFFMRATSVSCADHDNFGALHAASAARSALACRAQSLQSHRPDRMVRLRVRDDFLLGLRPERRLLLPHLPRRPRPRDGEGD